MFTKWFNRLAESFVNASGLYLMGTRMKKLFILEKQIKPEWGSLINFEAEFFFAANIQDVKDYLWENRDLFINSQNESQEWDERGRQMIEYSLYEKEYKSL